MNDLLARHGTDGTSTATFSPCQTYRYTLTRQWDWHAAILDDDLHDGGSTLAWIMLNPSTADAMVDDPTIRRCVSFAKAWGFVGITVVNLFAVRSPDPAILRTHPDPIGPANDDVLRDLVDDGGIRTFMAAWGSHPTVERRAAAVVGMLRGAGAKVDCLGLTKTGHPRHPLYVKGDTQPVPYGSAA